MTDFFRPSMRAFSTLAWTGALIVATVAGAAATERGIAMLAPFEVVGDAIPQAIGGAHGDAGRGRSLVLGHDPANCIVCHAVPGPGVRFSGNLAPPLDDVARGLSVPQLRLRVVDSMRVHPATIMPSYYRTDGLDRVASPYHGKPILDAAQVEDVVAYLATLK